MDRSKKLIIAGVVGLGVLALIIFGLSLSRKPNVATTETDISQVTPVVIQNADGLKKVLLSQQYEAVVEELTNYLRTQLDKNIKEASISKGPSVSQDGKISFTVAVNQPAREFEVVIDRLTHFDKVIFIVPSANYEKTVEVFSDEGGDF